MSIVITATREHEIACGHRVVGHEGKCKYLHGHNYLFRFICEAERLDSVGRVIDFGVIKERLCMWLERNWDHRFLVWEQDRVLLKLLLQSPVLQASSNDLAAFMAEDFEALVAASLAVVPFNPTAENIAQYMLEVVGPAQLSGTGVRLTGCKVMETRKCGALAALNSPIKT
jgi:6-pyruvoyltetrahydropterin/6-carboxytetrahydropterin synthase